eukprot:Em0001g3031a
MTELERERRPTRFSARPPPRFATGTDFSLWIKRVELYIQEAGLPEEKKGAELVSLLEDEPFRIVSQLGLVSETVEYDAVKACLVSHFSPDGVELEWQAKMHVARQKAGESVLEFAGRLRVLADKGYPSWPPERRLEVARNQFIQGILSSTIQLKLLTDLPETLDDAVKLAYRLQTAELAQEHLKAEATIDDTRGGGSSCAIGRSDGQVHKLSQQIERLTEQLTKLRTEREPGKRNWPKKKLTCWHCVMAVNGEQLMVAGEIDLHLQIGTHQGKHKVLVVEQMLQQCLLGTDYLEKQKCLVDLGKRTLMSSTCHVVMGEKVVIPGYHQVRLPVRSGQIVVQILNPLPFPATLQADKAIGCFCCGAQVDVVSLEPVDTDTGVTCSALKTHSSEEVARAIESMVTRIDELSCADREKLKRLLCEFSDVISVGEKDLGRTNVLKHKVNTGDAPPIHQQARRMPYHQRETVKKMLDDMLQQDVIEASSGPWSSPIVLARKKDGTLRFCVDFRHINDVTKKEVHPLPRIDETLDMLGGAKWFSTLDLASGYWQVEMEPEHKEKTAFSTPFGTYQFKVMPLGLSNAPSTFQKLMEMVLAGLHWTTCLVYLDDIVIFSTTVEQHLSRLRDVLARLKKAGLKLKPSKCHILKKCVHYLGHIVSADGVKVDDDKIKCIVEWPTPVNLEELRRFLGIASYYRKFIKGFAHIAAPLHALTEKLKPWEWTGLCDEAFAQLKTKLSSPPILSFPQFNMQFTVDCDASLEGLGAVLSQENDRCVVAYASRVLTKQERQYCATRREMLALIWAIQYFKPYLWGRPFKVRTDHSALKWLKNFKDPHGQVARWLEILSEYDFTVEHRPGLKHGNADSLSRLPCRQCGASQDQVENLYSLEAALAQATESDLALWLPILTPTDQETLQNNDPALAQVMVWVESNSFPKSFPKDGGYWLQTLWAQQKYLVLRNGVLYRRWEDIPGKGLNKCLQFVLPQDLVPTVLEQLHNAPSGSHLGVSKTVEKVRCRFYWPGQRRDIERWCAACESCATRKAPPTKPRAAMQADLPSGPFERVAMDILGPLPITTRAQKYSPQLVEEATSLCDKYKRAFSLFSHCQNLYNKNCVTEEEKTTLGANAIGWYPSTQRCRTNSSIPSPLTLSGSYEPPELLEGAVAAACVTVKLAADRSGAMPKANPRQSTQSPRLAALLLGHNERNRGSNSSSSDSSPSRSRSCRRHKRRRVIRRGIIRITTHWGLPYLHQRSTEEGSVRRIRKAMLQYQSTICQLFSTFGPVAALKYDKLFRCTKDQTLRWDNLKEGLLLARRCATVSMLEGAIGPLSQAAEGLTLADPANTCPRTPPVATCMHELQQAMQDFLGCCQRRLYPCPLDTRRFPRRTARAVRAARYQR